jgi:threonine/homoserine/homoserine lactone efflux protein
LLRQYTDQQVSEKGRAIGRVRRTGVRGHLALGMTGHGIAGFAVVAAVVIVTPGPDTALTIRNAVRGGRRAGSATAAGVSTGQLVWASGTAFGAAAALAASAVAFRIVQLAGAAYLLLLGIAAARHAARGRPAELHDGRPAARSAGTAFRQGLLSNLSNPKMAAFFTGLLPPFAVGHAYALTTMLALGGAFAAMTFGWLSAYAAVAARAAPLLRTDAVRRALDAICAVVFVVLGIRILTDPRPA